MVILTKSLKLPDGHYLAYDAIAPVTAHAASGRPGVIFLHGLKSDMGGSKAMALSAHCTAKGYGFVRFDMFGHGQSSGDFEAGGPGRWRDDALAVIDQLTQGPQILVGSSMGGWIMLLAALARPMRIAGLIGIAAAPDFTEDLMWPAFTADQRAALLRDGRIEVPSDDGETPMPVSRHLIEDGRATLVLTQPMPLSCPVHLLHGQQDTSVPWERSLQLAAHIGGDTVTMTFMKDGDHRLSRPQDLAVLCDTLDRMIAPETP